MITTVNINIEDLIPFINSAFEHDNEIISLYDNSQKVESIEDVCNNIYGKIKNEFQLSFPVGVLDGDKKIGYYVCYKKTLISFGLNKEYRNKENLEQFFEFIKQQFGGTFQAFLFTYNQRAISWLQKCKMNVIFENVSLLQFDND